MREAVAVVISLVARRESIDDLTSGPKDRFAFHASIRP
jgi:hypothetical protein